MRHKSLTWLFSIAVIGFLSAALAAPAWAGSYTVTFIHDAPGLGCGRIAAQVKVAGATTSTGPTENLDFRSGSKQMTVSTEGKCEHLRAMAWCTAGRWKARSAENLGCTDQTVYIKWALQKTDFTVTE